MALDNPEKVVRLKYTEFNIRLVEIIKVTQRWLVDDDDCIFLLVLPIIIIIIITSQFVLFYLILSSFSLIRFFLIPRTRTEMRRN
jgi:hypothetical protein